MNDDRTASDVPPGEPARDLRLTNLLASFETTLAADDLAVARQRHRIATAARARLAAGRLAARQPAWWEWIARAARPLPIGMAAALVILALAVIRSSPAPETLAAANDSTVTAVSRIVAMGGGSEAIVDLLIAPSTPDSLLARAYAVPVASAPQELPQ